MNWRNLVHRIDCHRFGDDCQVRSGPNHRIFAVSLQIRRISLFELWCVPWIAPNDRKRPSPSSEDVISLHIVVEIWPFRPAYLSNQPVHNRWTDCRSLENCELDMVRLTAVFTTFNFPPFTLSQPSPLGLNMPQTCQLEHRHLYMEYHLPGYQIVCFLVVEWCSNLALEPRALYEFGVYADLNRGKRNDRSDCLRTADGKPERLPRWNIVEHMEQQTGFGIGYNR
jgi:hypothetical protein